MKRASKLRVMAEYGSSGIWAVSTRADGGLFRHGMVEHAALGLSAELAANFEAWIRRYEEEAPSGLLEVEDFNREGLSLATRLAAFVGSDRVVEYQGEAADGGLAPAIAVRA